MASTIAATKQIIMSDMFTNNNDVGVRRFRVSAEDAIVEAGFKGNVYTASGKVSLGGLSAVGFNFLLPENILLVKCAANAQAEVEISAYREYCTGANGDILETFNRNLGSDKTTSVAIQQVNNVTTEPNSLIDFSPDVLINAAIGAKNSELSVLIERRDNGAIQEVKFSLTFEVLEGNIAGLPSEGVPFIGLLPGTELIETTEMSNYG